MLEEKVEIKAEEYGDFVRLMREKVSVGADGFVKISDGLWFGMADLIEGLGKKVFEPKHIIDKNATKENAERDSGMDTSSTAAAVPLPQGEGSEESSHETEPFFEDDEEEGNAVGGEIFGAALRETKTIGEDRYRCEVCVNAGTPLCESCNSISSNGNTSRPTRFMGFTEVDSRRQELTVHAYNIVHHVRKGQPLPLKWVMEYNQLMCGTGERD